MVVFISGPMSGIEGLNKEAFNKAEELLRSVGFIVLNPAVLPEGLPEEKYMPICMSMIDAADYIFLLPGWASSMGSTAEYYYASKQSKHVLVDDGGAIRLRAEKGE